MFVIFFYSGGDTSDGDHYGDDESVGMKDTKSVDNEGFIKPTSHECRHCRVKRAAEIKSTTHDSDPEGATKRPGTPARMGQGGRSPHLPRRWWGEVGRASAPLVN